MTPCDTEESGMQSIHDEVRNYYADKYKKAGEQAKLLKQLLGSDSYHDLADFFVVNSLQDMIESHIENIDRFETPDNVTLTLASMCQTLKYFMVHEEYESYMENLKATIWKPIVETRYAAY